MKVILINGSPRNDGNTFLSLSEVANELNQNGIDSEIIQIGHLPLTGCKACGYCGKNDKKCVFDDGFNQIAEKIRSADGLVIGSPVYYAGLNGTVKSFLDRLFYTSSSTMRFKPAAGLVALRRAGGVAAMEEINRFFLFSEMIITPTRYWSVIHGRNKGDAVNDLEGMQIARNIGKNMSFMLKIKENQNTPLPDLEDKIMTNL